MDSVVVVTCGCPPRAYPLPGHCSETEPLTESFPCCKEILTKPSMVVHTSDLGAWEVRGWGGDVQRNPQLLTEFKACLGYKRSCLKNTPPPKPKQLENNVEETPISYVIWEHSFSFLQKEGIVSDSSCTAILCSQHTEKFGHFCSDSNPDITKLGKIKFV